MVRSLRVSLRDGVRIHRETCGEAGGGQGRPNDPVADRDVTLLCKRGTWDDHGVLTDAVVMSRLHHMALFEEEKLIRLTVSITSEQRRELAELAKRAGHKVSLARVARAALTEGMRVVRRNLEGEAVRAAK